MTAKEAPAGKFSPAADRTAVLLDVVAGLVRELHAAGGGAPRVTLDSALERELGFDSLSRVELLARIERTFGVTLSEQVFTNAETPGDLLRLLTDAGPSRTPRWKAAEHEPALEEASAAPADAQTLTEVLEWHVRAHPDRPHVYLLAEDGGEERLSYRDLLRGAQSVAAGLQSAGLGQRQTVAIMLPTGKGYLFSFFGTLLAGGIPVPIYPPARLAQIGDHLRRHAAILANARVSILITVPEARALARLLQAHVQTLQRVTTPDELLSTAGAPAQPFLGADDTAFLQYTSGSTANPKGVVLSHRNLLTNMRGMGEVLQVDSTDVFVSWLPMYHDMGLIGAWLATMYHAIPLVLMSPLTFLARPVRWLWAIHRHRATLSAGPNFAYELCARKIDDAEVEGLDLRSWRMAANGAEPVSADSLQAFSQRFSQYGFRAEAMYPVYGLAEATLGLAFPPLGRGPLIDRIQREPFTRDGRALPAADDDTQALRFVGCGYVVPGHEIRIVDSTGAEVGDREEGRLEFRGPSTTKGYFRNAEATRKLFDGDWLDSGDLAYIADGEVFITGRVKDVIIRAGRNIYPQELEEAIGNIAGIRRGCVAVFPAKTPGSTSERLVVLAETHEREAGALSALHANINSMALDVIGMPADDIVLAPPHTVLKTSSGKIRRAASRERYEQGRLGKPVAAWRQLARFAWTGLRPQLRRARRLAADLLYAAYAWLLFIGLMPPAWMLLVLLPHPRWGWPIAHVTTRLLFLLSGTRLRIDGLRNLPAGPCVVVANHASYLDGILLNAVLPHYFSFVVKRELGSNFIGRVLFRGLGAEYVERFDKQRGAEDARRVGQVLQQGRSLVFFPEGTFLRMPGLLPFRMGAFVAAAGANVPVVPVTIRGTRAKLRADQWRARRGPVRVIIDAPIEPTGRDWSAGVALRDAARAQILRRCGEPDLGRAAIAI
jgi:1-acyl-sn-glycerol-3-phosphate acyltransferase